MRPLPAPLLLLARLPLLALLLAAPAHAWEVVEREAGIVVSEKEVPGRSLPTFRGVGHVNGSILEILAILNDSARRCEWQHKCAEARLIERINDFESILYNRSDAPWPVDDRDTVVHSKLFLVEDDVEVVATFSGTRHPRMPEVEDVVRMPSIEGHYRLRRVSPSVTRVEYQVNADPGGWLPDWLASRASRDLPLETLKGLRRQVRKMRGRYPTFMAKWDAARLPEGGSPPQPPRWTGR